MLIYNTSARLKRQYNVESCWNLNLKGEVREYRGSVVKISECDRDITNYLQTFGLYAKNRCHFTDRIVKMLSELKHSL